MEAIIFVLFLFLVMAFPRYDRPRNDIPKFNSLIVAQNTSSRGIP